MEANPLSPDTLDSARKIRRARLTELWGDVNAAIDEPYGRLVALAVELLRDEGLSLTRAGGGPVDGTGRAVARPTDNAGAPRLDDALSRIGHQLGLTREEVELVYDGSGEAPEIVINASKLAKDKANASRQLAQLVAAGRQGAGVEEWTLVSTVRAIVANYGKLDANNFAGNLAKLEDVALWRGKGGTRALKLTKQGYETTGAMVKSLVGRTG